MIIQKSNANIFVLLLGCLFFLSNCGKETITDLVPEIVLTPIEIHKEACYSPSGMTLILTHPDDNFYYNDLETYHVKWNKNGALVHEGYRLDCAVAGEYEVEILFLDMGQTQYLQYELIIEDEEF